MNGEENGEITRSVPLFTPVTVPVLSSVDGVLVAKLSEDRKQYEEEVDEMHLEI